MNIQIYGIIGQAGALEIPLDEFDIDELEIGREFMHRGKVYEIRSLHDTGTVLRINVVVSMDAE